MAAQNALYTELWKACAGPLVTVPRENELVFYFPQGHIEQVSFSFPFSPFPEKTFMMLNSVYDKGCLKFWLI